MGKLIADMNKKGAEDILMTLGYILIIIGAIFAINAWIDSASKGDLVKDQVVAKQTALLIDAASPGSVIFVNKDVTLLGGKAIVGKSGYTYFTRHTVNTEETEGGTNIVIS